MYEEKTFTVKHPTGYLEINVGRFFGTTNKPQISKLLRLAKKHCSEEQRKQLIERLRFERNYRRNVLETLAALEERRRELLNDLPLAVSQADLGPEKALKRQITKLDAAIDVVKEARWNP